MVFGLLITPQRSDVSVSSAGQAFEHVSVTCITNVTILLNQLADAFDCGVRAPLVILPVTP